MPPTKRKSSTMIALDTETTGRDFHHGTLPFFVVYSDEQYETTFYEWDVDPLTRDVDCPLSDWQEIQSTIDRAENVVLHNAKFDVSALTALAKKLKKELQWSWPRTYDTIMASHLLNSAQLKDLTKLTKRWTGVEIQSFEDELEKAVKECRRIVQGARLKVKKAANQRVGKLPISRMENLFDEGPEPPGLIGENDEFAELAKWRIADEDDPEIPSTDGEMWRADYWLPRAMATYQCLSVPDENCEHEFDENVCSKCEGHLWWIVLRNYACQDAPSTMACWLRMEQEIKRRNLGRIYEERMKCLPIAFRMEQRGITINRKRLNKLKEKYRRESDEALTECLSIAADLGYDLQMPKGASPNDSLRAFCYDCLELEPIHNPGKKSDRPSFDKAAIEHYLNTLPHDSIALKFLKALTGKRKRDSYLAYMAGYERFMVGGENESDWYVLHPRLNPCGTDTLRWSSNNPNGQNISKKGLFQGDVETLRFLFGPEDGREWWSFDAKNMELRIPGYESKEKDLIDLFESPDKPPYYGSEHLLNFSVVFDDVWEKELQEVGFDKVGPHVKEKYETTLYHRAKCGGFAIGYGAVERHDGAGTADKAFGRPGSHAKLKTRFANKEKLNQHYIAQAERHGYVETIPDKSVDPDRGYPLECKRTSWGKIKPTVPLNYHVQSTAMWWTMRAMIRVQAQLDKWREEDGFDGFITLQVHDELVLDFPKRGDPVAENKIYKRGGPHVNKLRNSNLWRVKIIQRLMEQGGDDIGVRTPTGCEYHDSNWSEGVTLS